MLKTPVAKQVVQTLAVSGFLFPPIVVALGKKTPLIVPLIAINGPINYMFSVNSM